MILKKKKQYVSKAEITEFFMFYNYDFLRIKRLIALSIFLYIFLTLRMLLQLRVESLVVLLVLILLIGVIRLISIKKKALKVKDLDFNNINNFISFFETPGERRKKNFKNIVEKLETAYIHHYKLYNYEFFAKISFYIIFIFYFFLILYDHFAFYYFDLVLNFRVQIVENLSLAYFLLTLLTIFFQFRGIEYKNVEKTKEWLKYYIDEKLTNITININNFIQTPNDKIKDEDHQLILDLNSWYNYYCSHFSSNKELNELFNSYIDLIFDYDEELFYLENFSNLKTRITDLMYYFEQKVEKNVESQKLLLEILKNYIQNLESNISMKKEKIIEKREKRRSQQTTLNLILAPLSFCFSVISISLNFII